MKSDPCVRFGMRINPKIREKPADNRNSRPPNVMLLTASNSQKVMSSARCPDRGRRCEAAGSSPSALQRRKVARIDRLGEKLVLIIGPKLTHVLVGFDGLVDELAARSFTAAHV